MGNLDAKLKFHRSAPMATPDNHEQNLQSALASYREGLTAKSKDALIGSLISVSNRKHHLQGILEASLRGQIPQADSLGQYAGSSIFNKGILQEHLDGLGKIVEEYEVALQKHGMSLEEIREERVKAFKQQDTK